MDGEGERSRMLLAARELVDFLRTRERREWVERRFELLRLVVRTGVESLLEVGVVESLLVVGERSESAEGCLVRRVRPEARRELRLGLKDGVLCDIVRTCQAEWGYWRGGQYLLDNLADEWVCVSRCAVIRTI